MRSIENKVVLVTGAASGIGLGIVKTLAQYGAKLIAVDISDRLEENVAPLIAQGHRIETEKLDLKDVHQIRSLFMRLADRKVPVSGLVNNAGITLRSDFLTASIEDFQSQFDINVRAAYLCSQLVAALMLGLNIKGSIVNISSNHAGASVEGFEAYAATKGALCSMTRAMAWSLGKHGIRVNSVSPGLTFTDAIAAAMVAEPGLSEVYQRLHATQRINQVEDVGELVAFFMSDSSIAVTGADLLGDNGMSARLFNRRYNDENN